MGLKKIILTLIIIGSCVGYITAQELQVKSVKLLSSDMTAKTNPCLTYGGDTCALIKIKGDGVAGLEFTDGAQYIDKRYDAASQTYFVYVYRTPKLTYKHQEYLPGEIDMSLSGYRKPKNGKTYLVTLEAKGGAMTGSIVMLKVNPISSVVTFDGKASPFSADGIYEYNTTPGNHVYSVKAEDYNQETGSIEIRKGENKSISLNLKPIMHEVDIRCNIREAKVFVDNEYAGTVGRVGLPQGHHKIRLQANGYIDIENFINISSTTSTLTYKLEKTNETHIHATPVKIFSDSKHIYKNGKMIKDWYSGAEIKFMPGKYGLSDEEMRVHEITVGLKPMTIIINGDHISIK